MDRDSGCNDQNCQAASEPKPPSLSELDLGIDLPPWLADKLYDPSQADHPVVKAFLFAYRLHQGQRRISGEPYISHPIEVANILKDLGGTQAMIAAGFLHDVVEDTSVSIEEIEAKFGSEVSHLVDGVTKLSKFNFDNKTERQAENFRRMFLAMAKDIRVIVVKLADRLHNMSTLHHLKPEKRQAIARETKEIFAPLANRLGIGYIKWQLEDLAFKYLEPEKYQQMEELVAQSRSDREEHLNTAIAQLRARLAAAKFENFDISGRPKHLYGIYHKMQRQQKQYSEIYDISALRVIVNNVDECYRILAIAHDLFRPIPSRFKDYIGLPKPNRYQSLHTAVMAPNGQPIEIQIRTWEMHRVAEYGIAAHWKYKESNSSNFATTENDEKLGWLRQLVDWQNEIKDAQEYLDSVKDDLFDSEIYVFTPKGDVYNLPRGATPVDFAYRIHTEVGNHCAGAKANNRLIPLERPLQSGDIVEIITQKNAHPSLGWMNFVVTNTAKNRVRQWFKKSHREEHIANGRALLEKEMGKSGLEQLLKSEQMLRVVERCNLHSAEDLLCALGYGELSINTVVNKLREQQREKTVSLPHFPTHPTAATSKSPILGVEGVAYHLAGCCKPLPGEPIIGLVTQGSNRSISIHRQDCNNLDHVQGDRLLPVSWNHGQADQLVTFPVDLRLETIDRVGILKDILSKLSDRKINVREARVKTDRAKCCATIDLSIDISDRLQFDKVCEQIGRLGDILSVRRVLQTE
ncbi:MAG: bifunctional (p)ppGpp synthetase/guanosine-3',5'-bis(diphosphate) 3'-pyrophosphohydrolase [Pseudanabaenaceae cyanobacterium bins.68]|nr:bifunctional (p)ppGpp synthetase/guanosine-3',5'-bis(diphosphate) 3'-pyrophosphohydrolase [Pseudanabaenaceae cyanobacterium bins.68]